MYVLFAEKFMSRILNQAYNKAEPAGGGTS